MKTFKSPDGFYTIQYPADWKVRREGGAISLLPRDERGVVTISAVYSETGEVKMCFDAMRETFAKMEAVVEFRPYEKLPVSGISGEFRQKANKTWRYWVARGLHLKHVCVLITADDVEADFPKRRPQYLDILDSIVLHEP
jgi:hypothetical protein